MTLVAGDTLEPLKNSGRQFDGLVSNPPYIRDDERSGLQPEVGLHEPAEALFSGKDGLDVIRKIVEQAPPLLKPGAFIVLEVDPSQCAAVALLLKAAGFPETTTRRDLSGHERVVEGTLI